MHSGPGGWWLGRVFLEQLRKVTQTVFKPISSRGEDVGQIEEQFAGSLKHLLGFAKVKIQLLILGQHRAGAEEASKWVR